MCINLCPLLKPENSILYGTFGAQQVLKRCKRREAVIAMEIHQNTCCNAAAERCKGLAHQIRTPGDLGTEIHT